MCESEKSWNNGYMGSGTKWSKHLNKHPDKSQPENINNKDAHYYKRTVIKSNFKTPKETRDSEIQEIGKYLKEDEKSGKITSTDNKCFNLIVRPQPLKYENGNVCEECGGINGEHKDNCRARSVKCPECGKTRGHHAKTCSHYKICAECGGGDGRHKSWCSKRKHLSV